VGMIRRKPTPRGGAPVSAAGHASTLRLRSGQAHAQHDILAEFADSLFMTGGALLC